MIYLIGFVAGYVYERCLGGAVYDLQVGFDTGAQMADMHGRGNEVVMVDRSVIAGDSLGEAPSVQ